MHEIAYNLYCSFATENIRTTERGIKGNYCTHFEVSSADLE